MHWLIKLLWYSTIESINANDWGDWSSKWWDLKNRFPSCTNRVQYFPRHVHGTSQPMRLYFPLSQCCTSHHNNHFFTLNFEGLCISPNPLHVLPIACPALEQLHVPPSRNCLYYPEAIVCVAHCLYCPWAPACTTPELLLVLPLEAVQSVASGQYR